MRKYLLLALALCVAGLSESQTILLVAKGGLSSYGDLYIGNLNGGGGDLGWKQGPMLSLGVRVRTSAKLAFEGIIEYSSHRYTSSWVGQAVNDPRNRIVELSALWRPSWRVWDPIYLGLTGGLSLYSQKKDGFVTAYENYRYEGPATSLIGAGVVFGWVLEARMSDQWELSVEGNLRMRRYFTPVIQLGIAYAI